MYTKLTISERLKDLRVDHKLTLEQLAEQTGLSKSALGKYESDDFTDISPFAIVTLAKFYGVSADYLMGLTEQKNHPSAELDALHLSDGAIEVLKSGAINNRLLSELICHGDFRRFMVDMEIYVDRLASMQIDNLNAGVDITRQMIAEKYYPDELDLHFRTLELTHIHEDEYFSYTLRDDLISILHDIRQAHAKDTVTAPETSVAGDFQKNVREVIEARGTAKEKLLKTQMAALGIDYDSLTPKEIVTQVRILQKSKLLKNATSQRGKASPYPTHGHGKGKKHR